MSSVELLPFAQLFGGHMQERNPATPAAMAELQDRIAVLEKELAALKSTIGQLVREANAKMLATFGSMPDDEISRDAERLGRAYRERQPKC